jgi:hypothetical protein
LGLVYLKTGRSANALVHLKTYAEQPSSPGDARYINRLITDIEGESP